MLVGSTQPLIQWVPRALSLGVKRPGHEAGHSAPSSAEVKNAWSYTSTPQYALMACCLVKHRDNFTFTFYKMLVGKPEWMKPFGRLKCRWEDYIKMDLK
jgi:hypothetical protein